VGGKRGMQEARRGKKMETNGPAEKPGGGGRHKFGALGVDGSIILKSEGRVFEGADWTDMLPVGSSGGPI